MNKTRITTLLRKLKLMHLGDRVNYYFQKYKNRSSNQMFKEKYPDVVLPPDYMIYESFQIKHADDKKSDPSNLAVLFILAMATSIDALAVGITLSLLNVNIIFPVVIIGLITFLLSYAGVYIGKRFGHFFESKIEALGGVVLIVLGFKILFEHLFAK